MSQLPSSQSISMPTGATILISGAQGLQPAQMTTSGQLGPVGASGTMIQLPSSMAAMATSNMVPTGVTVTNLNLSTATATSGHNPNATTYILNPSGGTMTSMQVQPQQQQLQQQFQPQFIQQSTQAQPSMMVPPVSLIQQQQQLNTVTTSKHNIRPLMTSGKQPIQSQIGQLPSMPPPQLIQTSQPQFQQAQVRVSTPTSVSTNGFISQQQQQPSTGSNGTQAESKASTSQANCGGSGGGGGGGQGSVNNTRDSIPSVVVLDKQRLQELVHEVDPNEQLEDDVADVLLKTVDHFIESLVGNSCRLARHRMSTTLDVRDVEMVLEKNWGMWVPGFGVEGVVGVASGTAGGGSQGGAAAAVAASHKPKRFSTEAHKQRMALIKKAKDHPKKF